MAFSSGRSGREIRDCGVDRLANETGIFNTGRPALVARAFLRVVPARLGLGRRQDLL